MKITKTDRLATITLALMKMVLEKSGIKCTNGFQNGGGTLNSDSLEFNDTNGNGWAIAILNNGKLSLIDDDRIQGETIYNQDQIEQLVADIIKM
jgi:hypothetical protein